MRGLSLFKNCEKPFLKDDDVTNKNDRELIDRPTQKDAVLSEVSGEKFELSEDSSENYCVECSKESDRNVPSILGVESTEKNEEVEAAFDKSGKNKVQVENLPFYSPQELIRLIRQDLGMTEEIELFDDGLDDRKDVYFINFGDKTIATQRRVDKLQVKGDTSISGLNEIVEDGPGVMVDEIKEVYTAIGDSSIQEAVMLDSTQPVVDSTDPAQPE
jgi:hypothetical protein